MVNICFMAFHKWGYPQNVWFMMENPSIKWMMQLGAHPYDLGNLHMAVFCHETDGKSP